MNSVEDIIKSCRDYIDGKFEIEELQRKIEKIVLPDKYKNTLEKEQHNFVNELEEIQYSYLPENQRSKAKKLAEKLIYIARLY